MPEVPKIVRERLRAAGGAAGGTHPDGNVLAAFAEQALAASEREGVLQHLALCGECREAIALSMPLLEVAPKAAAAEVAGPAASAVRVPPPGRQPWFAWHRLGWAGLAAGIVIAAGVLVMQPGRQKMVHEAQQKPAAKLAEPAGTPEANQAAPRPSSSEVTATAENRPSALVPPAASRRDELTKLAQPAAAPREFGVEETLQASVGKKDVQADRALESSASRQGSTTQTVAVTGGAAAPAPERMQTADALARNEAAPVLRAKAARAAEAPVPMAKTRTGADAKQESAVAATEQRSLPSAVGGLPAQSAGASTFGALQRAQVPSQWAIHGNEVQQSLDAGTHWNTVFQPHRPLLCVAAANTDVWAGGTQGGLFHSADSGATWNQVHPSISGQTLADDITHIDVHSSSHVVLLTSKHESWSTTDGGTTWAKK